MARQVIGHARTLRGAQEMLEDMFANGEVDNAGRPRIDGPITYQYTANGVTEWRTRYEITEDYSEPGQPYAYG